MKVPICAEILESSATTLELEARLQGKLRGRIRQFQVLFHECGIILRGFAQTYHAKQLAQHAVMMETDVPILANEIEVR